MGKHSQQMFHEPLEGLTPYPQGIPRFPLRSYLLFIILLDTLEQLEEEIKNIQITEKQSKTLMTFFAWKNINIPPKCWYKQYTNDKMQNNKKWHFYTTIWSFLKEKPRK